MRARLADDNFEEAAGRRRKIRSRSFYAVRRVAAPLRTVNLLAVSAVPPPPPPPRSLRGSLRSAGLISAITPIRPGRFNGERFRPVISPVEIDDESPREERRPTEKTIRDAMRRGRAFAIESAPPNGARVQ